MPLDVRHQLAFDFGERFRGAMDREARNARAVQLSFEDWKPAAARCIEWLDKDGESSKRAARLRSCGSMIQVRRCTGCRAIDVKSAVRSADCETRICPSCQRQAAQERRKILNDAIKTWPYQRRGKSWWFHTISVRRRPGVSVQTLREDAERAFKALHAAWKIWKHRGAERCYAKVEVGLAGMVHVHVLAYHPWLPANAIEEVRCAVSPFTGGRVYNIKRARKGSIAEVAKYFTKGVALSSKTAKQTHPLLAAQVDVAFRGARLVRELGDWDALGFTPPDNDNHGWFCPACGCCDGERAYMDEKRWLRVLRGVA